jgi:8-amino-3,8-dideoxy-alpha-D-manno-octulosonate transaminase
MPGFELFDDAERREVNDVLNTGILMRYGFDGPRQGTWKSLELEAEIVRYFGTGHAQLVSSGTAALTTAMAALGIGAGDEVIMPSFTFVASFEAVISVGAIPVLVEIDESLTLDPAAVEAAITSRTKAVMPVHMCGGPADLRSISAICTRHNLLLLEDACQAIGGTFDGKHLGTIGHAGTFSFDFVKTVTCAEGGAVLTNSEDIWRKCDAYSDHGHDHLGKDRGADLHPFLGYNYRISELHAAVGLAQMRKLDNFLSIQRRNASAIAEALGPVPGLEWRRTPEGGQDTGAFVSFYLPTEGLTREAIAALAADGLTGNFYWYDNNWHYIRKWMHLKNGDFLHRLSEDQRMGVLHYANLAFPQSDAVMSRCISSSVSLLWSEEESRTRGEQMANVLRRVMEKATVTI